ncbi:MAG: apolipoprotein N-acyltransferase [Epsilonproteobacteria bacterium]|nr:MAG: apolipoprotein N-acyltransferase [Campylobacterota bacterium]
MSGYITTFQLTRGFFAALLASLFLYLAWIGWSHPLPNTILAILALYLLLLGESKVWILFGFFIGLFWFWWIMMSFRFYGFPWAMPIGIFLMGLLYAIIFGVAAILSHFIEARFHLPSIWIKALFLLVASTIHPFGFDWFKPELMFVESYIGIEKWQLFIVLMAILMTILKQNLLFLFAIIFAYQPLPEPTQNLSELHAIKLITTDISVENKWNPKLLDRQIDLVMQEIDTALHSKKKLIIFPESVLPIFLNKNEPLLTQLKEMSKKISIVLGALKWDEGVPRNSAYIFHQGKVKVTDKIVLVPFGERNPLPDWLGEWVNKIFYDDAVDYEASSVIIDYTLGNETYRNAICYESCSEQLYIGSPKKMIVMSNNGWFTPSIEPTLQRLLLQYYSRKYGTTIYHSVNMSPSYIIQKGRVVWRNKRR